VDHKGISAGARVKQRPRHKTPQLGERAGESKRERDEREGGDERESPRGIICNETSAFLCVHTEIRPYPSVSVCACVRVCVCVCVCVRVTLPVCSGLSHSEAEGESFEISNPLSVSPFSFSLSLSSLPLQTTKRNHLNLLSSSRFTSLYLSLSLLTSSPLTLGLLTSPPLCRREDSVFLRSASSFIRFLSFSLFTLCAYKAGATVWGGGMDLRYEAIALFGPFVLFFKIILLSLLTTRA